MKVILRHPKREVEVVNTPPVSDLLERLDIVPEAVLVIRDGELLTAREPLQDSDTVELRTVILPR